MDEPINTLKQELQEALARDDDKAVQDAYTDLGQAFFRQSMYPQAMHCFEKLLTLSHACHVKNDAILTNEGLVYCHMGLIFLVQGEYAKVAQTLFVPVVEQFGRC